MSNVFNASDAKVSCSQTVGSQVKFTSEAPETAAASPVVSEKPVPEVKETKSTKTKKG